MSVTEGAKDVAHPSAKTAPSCALVIFGAGGDLTKRLIIPALYNLTKAGLLPDKFAVIGVDHNDRSSEDWRNMLHEFLEATVKTKGSEFEATSIDEQCWDKLAGTMSYMTGDFLKAESYQQLGKVLEELNRKQSLGGRVLFYLAVAERFFGAIVDRLGAAGLVKEEGEAWRRVIIEKPFGHDYASAVALNAQVLRTLREGQIYRIDHFLGKETVQNIMALRFANGLFEPLWNRDRIDHVQITVAETIGIGTRARFYEPTGALRDMVPNHLFQLVAMTAMEPPVSFDANAVRDKRGELFAAVRPLTVEDAVRGQYGAGEVDGKQVPAYRDEANVAPDSSTETYAALRLTIDNWRWAGVPFYLRTGKRLSRRYTEIAIHFKDAPYALFRDTPVDQVGDNWLILQIQPDEGIRLLFNAKEPGPKVVLDNVSMDFKYGDWFRQQPAVGYETLIYDCLVGDATLFQRADQVEAAWRVVQPVLDAWAGPSKPDFPNYTAGKAGPAEADAMLRRDGRAWRKVGS
ncbi:MAG TPA: glucose-6-phosphate dehydrogenase [Stellaceae bacterium]|jgi:glucose-6-phosphate 1-dehydrogenase|nr:glucose-6-phosphate dehydrogenase [Stellaceae bacterium]